MHFCIYLDMHKTLWKGLWQSKEGWLLIPGLYLGVGGRTGQMGHQVRKEACHVHLCLFFCFGPCKHVTLQTFKFNLNFKRE